MGSTIPWLDLPKPCPSLHPIACTTKIIIIAEWVSHKIVQVGILTVNILFPILSSFSPWMVGCSYLSKHKYTTRNKLIHSSKKSTPTHGMGGCAISWSIFFFHSGTMAEDPTNTRLSWARSRYLVCRKSVGEGDIVAVLLAGTAIYIRMHIHTLCGQ